MDTQDPSATGYRAGQTWLARAYQAVLWLACLTFGAALVGYAYTGTFARYWADDYCYQAALRMDGFWRAQVTFYQTTSDRFSVIPLVGISEWFGSLAVRVLPLLAVGLCMLSLVWLFRRLGMAESAAARLFLTEVVTFFTLWQAPNLFQVLYWRTGMLTYFFPLIMQIFLAGWVLRRAARGAGWAALLVTFLLAFFAGGFSETTAALQVGAVGLAFVGCGGWVWRRWPGRGSSPARTALSLLLAALAGTLLAMLLLVLSPSNALRMVHMPHPASLDVLLRQSLRFGWDFIRDTLVSQPLPTLLSALLPFVAAVVAAGLVSTPVSTRRKGAVLAGVLGMTYLLIVSVCAPSVYVEVAYPEPRALIAARLVMTLGLVTSGWLAGQITGGLLRGGARLSVWAAALALLAGMACYPLRAAQINLSQSAPYYQARAAGWDARDREIRQQIAQGQTNLRVQALDSIAGLMELQPDAHTFPNGCAAAAYGVESISVEER